MAKLLLRPAGATGKVHDVTPASAGWGYVGFGLYRLAPGETVAEATGGNEVILVMVEGKAAFTAADRDWGTLGERMSVFEKTPPHCLYVPNGEAWEATATTDCTLAVCLAPGRGGHPARRTSASSATGSTSSSGRRPTPSTSPPAPTGRPPPPPPAPSASAPPRPVRAVRHR